MRATSTSFRRVVDAILKQCLLGLRQHLVQHAFEALRCALLARIATKREPVELHCVVASGRDEGVAPDRFVRARQDLLQLIVDACRGRGGP